MIYKKLLLTANGGIISTQQQSEAAKNTATLFIGLGGTGVEAIRHVKSQVYRRLRPDNVDASIPEYKRIRFLGVDTDESDAIGDKTVSENNKANTLLKLSETEYFNIHNAGFRKILEEKTLNKRPEYNWARSKEELSQVDLTHPGAGATRQIGRMLLGDRAEEFVDKVMEELKIAREGLTGPKINIHIFTGLSGGTGSGTFLDACYLIRNALKDVEATVLGYFFLPDVNLSQNASGNSPKRDSIKSTGYAALQELDYCMNLPHNGGKFTQIYKGGQVVNWDKPPVQLAHLISATDANKNVKSNAYNNAMHVTSEYVMELITRQFSLKEGRVFDMQSHFSNFSDNVETRKSSKKVGRSLDYVVIGASCAIVPMREINTYLAAGMFEKFSPQLKVIKPDEKEISEIISAAFTGSKEVPKTSIVDYLYRKLGPEIPFEPYNESWKYVKENGDKDLYKHYKDIYAENVKTITEYKNHLSSGHARIGSPEANETSLLSEIVKKLDEYVDKLKYGPVFVSNAISGAEGKNLLNVIEGLIAEVNEKLTDALEQLPQREKEHLEAKKDFDHAKDSLKAVLLQPTKKYERYLFYVAAEKEAELEIKKYKDLIEILKKLKGQLRDLNQKYYQKLSQVLVNTIDTFHQNLLDLNARKVVEQEATYEMQLMTIEELRETMDALIATKTPANVFEEFIGELTKDEASTAWLSDDEAKICKIINDYFVKDLFKENSQKTIELFLQEKYDTDNASELQEHIYKDFILELEKKAAPLFPYNSRIWDSSSSNEVKYLSIPETSSSIKSAANKLKSNNNKWEIKTTGLSDRIYMMRNACVIPLAAYAELEQYEASYFKSTKVGLHYYEGINYKKEPIKNMKFSDWRKLGPLTPVSLIDLEDEAIPTREKQLIENAESLFDKAKHFNLFDEEYHILELANYEESKEKLEKLLNQLKNSSPSIKELKAIESDLEESNISLKPSKLTLQSEGDPDYIDSLLIDYFVSSPALHEPLHETVNQLEELDALKDEIIQLIKERRYEIEVIEQGIRDFARAFAVGVFTIDKFKITYTEETEYGIPEEHLLSEMGQPFGDIPPYQAFLNYLELDSDMQNKILEQANTKLKEMDEAIVANQKMKEYLTKDKLAKWVKLIKGREDEEVILSFLKQFNQAFENSCDLLA